MGGGGGWFGMILGPIFMISVLALVIAAAVLLVRWLGGSGQAAAPDQPERTPLDILKERFARGEIDKEEFDERRRILGECTRSPKSGDRAHEDPVHPQRPALRH